MAVSINKKLKQGRLRRSGAPFLITRDREPDGRRIKVAVVGILQDGQLIRHIAVWRGMKPFAAEDRLSNVAREALRLL